MARQRADDERTSGASGGGAQRNQQGHGQAALQVRLLNQRTARVNGVRPVPEHARAPAAELRHSIQRLT